MDNTGDHKPTDRTNLKEDFPDVKKLTSNEMEDIDSLFDESEWEAYMQKEPLPLADNVSDDLFRTIQGKTIYAEATSVPKRQKIYSLRPLYRVVAAVAIFFFVALGIYYFTNPVISDAVVEQELVLTQQVTSGAASKTVHLPDGSVAILAPHSTLTYLSNFTPNERDISLVGSARFQVSKDPNRPFAVACNELVTVAVGTEFTVRETVDATEVTLHEGSVKVYAKSDKDHVSDLQAGDKISYSTKGGVWNYVAAIQPANVEERAKEDIKTSKAVDNSPAYVVERGQLVFKNVAFTKLVASLESIYGCTISFPKDMATSNMYLSIDTNQSVTMVLNNIVLLNDLQLESVGNNQYRIIPKK